MRAHPVSYRSAFVGLLVALASGGCTLAHERVGGAADAGASPDAYGELACGGLAGIACPTGLYCDFPVGSCGGDDELGVCRPIPTCTAGPTPMPVCGCDYQNYASACEANRAGTSVGRLGGCPHPTPAHPSISATPSCGPTDGPAWSFATSNGAHVCGPTDGATVTIDIWGDLPIGTPIAITTGPSGAGEASFCASGPSGPCVPLQGTVTFSAFVAGSSATYTYDLVDASGTHYPSTGTTVELWCPRAGFCG